MRKTFTCILLAAIFTTACQNRLNHNGALGAVEEAFYNQYPNAWDVEWEHGAGNTIVMDFKDGLYEREAWFLTDGTWLSTQTELAVNELPQTLVNVVMATLGNGWHIDDAEHTLSASAPNEYYTLECENNYTDRETRLRITPDGTIL